MKRPRAKHTHCVMCAKDLSLGTRCDSRRAAYCSMECKRDAERIKNKAYIWVSGAKRFGLIPRPETLKCADCGDKARYYDHRDYTKPMDVEPVCAGCNTRRGPGIHKIAA